MKPEKAVSAPDGAENEAIGPDSPAVTGPQSRAGYPRLSLRHAIDAKCKDCSYDHLDRGNWRQQVHACPCTDCPLWLVRPRSEAPL